MVILGIGLGIMYAGVLRLFRVFVEYRDITAQSAEAEAQVLHMAMELVEWGMEEAVFLLVFGVIIAILGLWHKKKSGIL